MLNTNDFNNVIIQKLVPICDSALTKCVCGSRAKNYIKVSERKITWWIMGLIKPLISGTSTTLAIFDCCKCSRLGSRSLHVEPIWNAPHHPIFSFFPFYSKDSWQLPWRIRSWMMAAAWPTLKALSWIPFLYIRCWHSSSKIWIFLSLDFYLTVHILDQFQNCQKKPSAEEEASLARTCEGQGFRYSTNAKRIIESQQFM